MIPRSIKIPVGILYRHNQPGSHRSIAHPPMNLRVFTSSGLQDVEAPFEIYPLREGSVGSSVLIEMRVYARACKRGRDSDDGGASRRIFIFNPGLANTNK